MLLLYLKQIKRPFFCTTCTHWTPPMTHLGRRDSQSRRTPCGKCYIVNLHALASRCPSHMLLAVYSDLFHILKRKPHLTGVRCQNDKKVHNLDFIFEYQTALFISFATHLFYFIHCGFLSYWLFVCTSSVLEMGSIVVPVDSSSEEYKSMYNFSRKLKPDMKSLIYLPGKSSQ